MKIVTCCRCKMQFGLPEDFYTTAVQMAERMTWHCPAGHPQSFISGETEADKLRRERDRLKQDQAYYEERIKSEQDAREAAERQAAARKGQITKMKNRASAGVCPCCNRSFGNLHRHMQTKHPKFTAEEVL